MECCRLGVCSVFSGRMPRCCTSAYMRCVLLLLVILSLVTFKQWFPAKRAEDLWYAPPWPTAPDGAPGVMENYTRKVSALAKTVKNAERLDFLLNRVSLDVLGEVLRGYKKAILFDLANIENKGDPAISLGELNILGRLNVTLIYYCHYYCVESQFREGKKLADEFAAEDVVILSSGGGNFGGYPFNDHKRILLARIFRDHKFVILPQSSWFHTPGHLEYVVKEYNAHPDMTILLRDEVSYNFTKKNFPRVHAVMAPDMAFSIGPVRRFFPPLYDVVWIHRADEESSGTPTISFPASVSYTVGDWFHTWPSPAGKHLIDKTYSMVFNGFLFELRGKVLVTDRLHGHILAALLDMPTVIIDNKIKKISSLANTWSKGLGRVVMAIDGEDACAKASMLLKIYDSEPIKSTARI